MINSPNIDYLVQYKDYDNEIYQQIFPLIKDDNLVSFNEEQYDIEKFNDNLLSEIFTDRQKIDDEEINDKEQKSNDKDLYENKIPENKDFENKSTNQNTNTNKNANINLKIEMIQPFKVPDNNLLKNKRREPSFDSPNEKINKNSINKKELFKIKKPKEKKEKKNNSSLVPDIKSFHTLLNIYFKYLMEKGNSFDKNVFNERGGANGYYLNKKFTQDKLGAENHSKKLDQKITNFIKDNKLEHLKKKKNKENLKILEFTVKQLIDEFRDYIFENSLYFKENETIKKINDNFVRIRKYPLIDFEKKEFGYYKYFSF
jgi:hypothetical protein